jgi:glycosyltransferase involved in cell wall biosynthesis
MPARILDVELTAPPAPIDLGAHRHAFVLLRLRGRPIGSVRLPCPTGTLEPAALRAAMERDRELRERLARAELRDRLLAAVSSEPAALPTWTVVVCTRERPDDLRRCIESLLALDAPPGGEILVVDNAPATDATRALVAGYPVRYARENRPGLNWARTTGARLARGEVVCYTDDDVVVDRGWLRALLAPFADPRVAAVTGIALPLELETEAQDRFEDYGGFGRGYEPWSFDLHVIQPTEAGRVGAGANMAIRRALLTELRLFEAELDCGTVARTGGDTYAFYRLLADGWRITYTPEAFVWHRHRRDLAALRRTLRDYSVGGFAFLLRCLVEHGDWSAVGVGVSWFLHDHVKGLVRTLLRRPGALPFSLLLPYWAGVLESPLAYRASRRRERALGPLALAEEAQG